jgi:hypothetical protein
MKQRSNPCKRCGVAIGLIRKSQTELTDLCDKCAAYQKIEKKDRPLGSSIFDSSPWEKNLKSENPNPYRRVIMIEQKSFTLGDFWKKP